jgi:hypothetical protein
MTKRSWLGHVGQGLGVLAGVLFAAAGLRLMTVAVAWAAESRAPVIALAAPAPAQRGPTGQGPYSTTRAATQAVERSEALPSGEPWRLMLAVSAGSPRSEVFVNGSKLGLSPYVGDYTCKRGEKLKVLVLPVTNQPLIEREAVCEGKTLRIEE